MKQQPRSNKEGATSTEQHKSKTANNHKAAADENPPPPTSNAELHRILAHQIQSRSDSHTIDAASNTVGVATSRAMFVAGFAYYEIGRFGFFAVLPGPRCCLSLCTSVARGTAFCCGCVIFSGLPAAALGRPMPLARLVHTCWKNLRRSSKPHSAWHSPHFTTTFFFNLSTDPSITVSSRLHASSVYHL